jgi:hypothetical protein
MEGERDSVLAVIRVVPELSFFSMSRPVDSNQNVNFFRSRIQKRSIRSRFRLPREPHPSSCGSRIYGPKQLATLKPNFTGS